MEDFQFGSPRAVFLNSPLRKTHPHLFEIDIRKSLNSSFGERESLGVLNTDFLNDSFVKCRESIGFIDANDFFKLRLDETRNSPILRPSILGKESLGLLDISKVNLDFLDYRKEPSLEQIPESEEIEENKISNPPFEPEPVQIFSISSKDLNASLKEDLTCGFSTQCDFNFNYDSPKRIISEFKDNVKRFWSGEKVTKTRTRRSLCEKTEENPTDNILMESIYVEARHLARKINTSNFDNSSSFEQDDLRIVQEPLWPEVLQQLEEAKSEPLNSPSIKSELKENCSQISSKEKSTKLIQNISEIIEEGSKSAVKRSTKSKAREANKLLHNLSEIFSSSNKASQKIEGENLLYSLAGLLCEESTSCSEDSGHSSIGTQSEGHEQTTNEEEPKPLDLSFRSNYKMINKNADTPITRNIFKNITNTNEKQTKQKPILAPVSVRTQNSTFKPKKAESAVVPKKGPLKALVPINSLTKTTVTSSVKAEKSSLVKSKPKWTSPVEARKITPMAQSTPTETLNKSSPSLTRKKRLSEPIQPGSEKQRKGLLRRRNSMDEGQIKDKDVKSSVGRDSGIASSLSKVRENIAKYRRDSSDTPVDSRKDKSGICRFSGSMPRVRKLSFGKENKGD